MFVSVIIVVAVFVAALFFLFGSGTSPPNMQNKSQVEEKGTQITEEPTNVVSLSTVLPRARNFDSDPEKDGVEVTVSPKDVDGNLVRTDGTVTARLWLSVFDSEGNRVRGRLLETWNNMPVSKSGYGDYGYKIVLPFSNYASQTNDYGLFEITLRTPDGKSFTAEETPLSLGIIA